MGIVNVTADSFYDGGRYNTADAAAEHALKMIEDGADIIDIGGASSRPGAELSSPEEETARVVPVIAELVRRAGGGVFISVDTTWSATARAAAGAGASMINDISAGRIDSYMARVVADTGCYAVLTHSRKTPKDMQDDPRYENVVVDVARELLASIKLFKETGVDDEKIIIDPGFGFGKTAGHNIELLGGIGEIARLDYPVLIGVSRKSFIGDMTGRSAGERLPGTLAATAVAYERGVRMFRVHDVKETVDFLKVLDRINNY